jgi:hypothetical protein
MNRSNVAIYSAQHSNSEGLIERQYPLYLTFKLVERQYCQHPLYLYPGISVETPKWTDVTLPSIHYSIRIQRAVLKVNIFNTHSSCTLTFTLKLQYEP